MDHRVGVAGVRSRHSSGADSRAHCGGTVSFADNGVMIPNCGSRPVNATTGRATCPQSYFATSSHAIWSRHLFGRTFADSTSSILTQVVNDRTATATSLSSPTNPSICRSPGHVHGHRAARPDCRRIGPCSWRSGKGAPCPLPAPPTRSAPPLGHRRPASDRGQVLRGTRLRSLELSPLWPCSDPVSGRSARPRLRSRRRLEGSQPPRRLHPRHRQRALVPPLERQQLVNPGQSVFFAYS